jgi:hypothetical protein
MVKMCQKCNEREATNRVKRFHAAPIWVCEDCYLNDEEIRKESARSVRAFMAWVEQTRKFNPPRPGTPGTSGRQRVAEFLATIGHLYDEDLYQNLRLYEIDAKVIEQYLDEFQEAARAHDDPGNALDEIWCTVLTHIMRRAAQVNNAGDSEPG